jgi:predicted nucleic acid-binding protein
VSYLLDTDTLSDLVKRTPSVRLLDRLAVVPADEQFTSAINVGEIFYGAFRSNRTEYILERLETLVWPRVRVLPFDTDAAFTFGRLQAGLERQGVPLAEADLRIAAVALARGLTVVTGNVRHFGRVPGLAVENWLE